MGKYSDPEHPGKFSSSLCAGLAMLTCFTAEHPVRGIADMAEELDVCGRFDDASLCDDASDAGLFGAGAFA